MNILERKKKRDNKPVTGGRTWLFRFIIIVVIPALLLLLVEGGLHIVGYGFPTSFTNKYMWKGQPAFCDNNKFTWQFFPKSIAREVDPFIFLEKKPADTYRIFIMGGSAAQGIPDPAFSFGRILQVMLEESYPGITFEIINTAITAINSHVVLEIAKDLAGHDGDLFVIYMGNNEVVGPYGAGTIFSPISPSLSLIRLGIALKSTKLGQLYFNALQSIRAKKNTQISWRGLEMFLSKQVRANDPHLEFVYKHFQKNLEDICSLAHKKGIKVILSTVGCNLKDSPPFASLHRKDLTDGEMKKWKELYHQAMIYDTDAEYEKAARLYMDAADIDNQFAELQFRLGRCFWMSGDFEKARQRYMKARELDTLRFRVDQTLNQIIRQVAETKKNQDVMLADSAKKITENSPHHTPGEELFYEHVHLNFKGHFIIAKALFTHIEKILPQWVKDNKSPGKTLITRERCAKALAYTDWDRFNLAYTILHNYLKKPPYNNQLFHEEREQQMESKLKRLSAFLLPESLEISSMRYSDAIKKRTSDWWLHLKYAELLQEDLIDFKKSAHHYRIVKELLPHAYHGYAGLGYVLLHQGRFKEAIKMDLTALNINPFRVDIYNNLGLSFQMAGQFEKAEEQYLEAIRLQPHYVLAYKNLGMMLNERGRSKEGIKICQKGLKFNPKSWRLHHTLGILFKTQGDAEAAVKELNTALRINPGSKETREILNEILREKSNF